MREIAENHLNQHQISMPARVLPRIKAFGQRHGQLIGLGALSITLYGLLYWLNTDIKTLAQATHTGHKQWFFVPIIVALVFSLIHGAFTAHFWDALGVKAKQA